METDPQGHAAIAIDLQKRYWSFNQPEFDRLHLKLKQGTTWAERLRLLHLCCAGMMRTEDGEAALKGDFGDDELEHHLATLAAKLAKTLLSEKSPFRQRSAAIWRGAAPPTDEQPPHHMGVAYNPSLSHLGCIEYLTVDGSGRPDRIGFAPIHAIRTLAMASPSLFRAGKIFYEDQREEMVLIPLIYGFSWFSSEPYDQDGSMTRFVLHVKVPGLPQSVGIGLGQQDWSVTDDKNSMLIGIGSMALADMPLDLREYDWEAKARLRGLDPEEIKRQVGPPT